MLDPLELRRLFAIPVNLGIATINGTGGNDVLELVLNGGVLQLRNGAGTVVDSVSGAGLLGVAVNAGDGNDFVRLGRGDGSLMPTIGATIRGNPGNDTLIGGNSNDQIFGDIGDDKLDGRAGRDVLDGSSGFDTADYGYRQVAVQVSLLNNATANDGSNSGNNSSPAQYNDTGGDNVANMEAVVGGSAADRLVGSASANWFDGGGGNDSIFGGAGIDTITGGVNNDLAYGEGEEDYFFVQDTTGDQFLGGAGTTFASFDSGIDTPAPALGSSPQSLVGGSNSPTSLLGPRGAPGGGSSDLELDDTFGPDLSGKVVTAIGDTVIQINDVAIQKVQVGDNEEEEKIIVVGTAAGPGGSDDFVIIRYNSDGSLDSTFGPNESGIVYTDFGSAEVFTTDIANSVAIDDDGNIIVAGSTVVNVLTRTAGFTDFAIAKYLPNGTPDDDFGDGGQSVLDPDGLDSDASAARVAIQQFTIEEQIVDYYVVAGTIGPSFEIESSDSNDFGVVRLTSSGAFDESFGLIRTDFGGEGESQDFATGLAIDPTNRNIWVSGFTNFGEGPSDFAVAGFFDDGTPISGADQTFDFGADDQAADAVIDGNQLLVVGSSNDDGEESGAIAAFDIEVIPSVGPGSVLNSALVSDARGPDLSFRGVELDDEGHGVAVGSLGASDFYIHRFNPADLSPFGAPTVVDFAFEGNTIDDANAVALQGDGKLVVAGVSEGAAALVRLRDGNFVDVEFSPEDVQNFNFTYIDENGDPQPVPDYLVQRIKALKPDGTLEIFGTEFGDVIKVTQTGDIITVENNGDLLQVPAVQVKKIVIHGLGGDDIIETDGSVRVPFIIEGNAGNDQLRGGPKLNELNGGPGDDIVMGLRGLNLILGSTGNDVLVGGDFADLLYGDGGRDILIGGKGPDALFGGADDDILIGGFTSFDNNPAALAQLMAEWSSSHNYDKRIEYLSGKAGGLNGTTFLKAGVTVFDDRMLDLLHGDGDKDWFIASKKLLLPDIILDLKGGEKVTLL